MTIVVAKKPDGHSKSVMYPAVKARYRENSKARAYAALKGFESFSEADMSCAEKHHCVIRESFSMEYEVDKVRKSFKEARLPMTRKLRKRLEAATCRYHEANILACEWQLKNGAAGVHRDTMHILASYFFKKSMNSYKALGRTPVAKHIEKLKELVRKHKEVGAVKYGAPVSRSRVRTQLNS